ncbi:hypothetical protein BU202_06610 [Streptococcus cuniculi]|uniref:Uncharacterized protein n=1 Tax=Streptococcus cuniculi TaxID=1432788 RepID=A0A1Q8E7E2_9STRE|nr:hypothetical protein BU202_06610 [Streptococcus cuniculi]
MSDFVYTDRQLNYLNRGKYVYSVNLDFSRKNKTNQVVESPSNKNQTNILEVDNQQFKVIKTYSDPRTGLNVNKRAKTAVIRSHRCLRSFLLLKSLWEHELLGEVMS